MRWAPGRDTWWAVASVVLLWACYWANTHLTVEHPLLGGAVFFVLGNLLVCTVLPALVVTRVAGEGWSGLGFTRRRLWWALGLGAFFGLGSLPYYVQLAAAEGVAPLEHLAYNVVVLWEPLFVYGWLQLRFARAFGWLPAIVLAAAGFAAYHLGSVPWESVLAFFATGLVMAALMAITRNIWVIFPLASGVASAIGTLQAGLVFDWSTAVIGAVILIVQAAILVFLVRGRSPKPGDTSRDFSSAS